jgi:mRNA-degrading endonuclease toxin of MazEF toxin-antitoxin module
MGKTIENPHIRISVHAKATLRELALHEGKPMQAVLDEAIEHYQRERFLDEAGREQAGTRPALVFSVDKFNHGPADLLIVLPITSKNKSQPLHVEVTPPEGGLKLPSFIKCDDILWHRRVSPPSRRGRACR